MCVVCVSSLFWFRLLVPVIDPTVRSLTLHRHANLLLAAASVFFLQSHLHPIPNQMENGTLLSPRFEFPRPLAADRTQICHRSYCSLQGNAETRCDDLPATSLTQMGGSIRQRGTYALPHICKLRVCQSPSLLHDIHATQYFHSSLVTSSFSMYPLSISLRLLIPSFPLIASWRDLLCHRSPHTTPTIRRGQSRST